MKSTFLVAVIVCLVSTSCSSPEPTYPKLKSFTPSVLNSYQMGVESDIPFLHTIWKKTVNVEAFYMDQSEITSNEYRTFDSVPLE